MIQIHTLFPLTIACPSMKKAMYFRLNSSFFTRLHVMPFSEHYTCRTQTNKERSISLSYHHLLHRQHMCVSSFKPTQQNWWVYWIYIFRIPSVLPLIDNMFSGTSLQCVFGFIISHVHSLFLCIYVTDMVVRVHRSGDILYTYTDTDRGQGYSSRSLICDLSLKLEIKTQSVRLWWLVLCVYL